jgi:Putative peptidoglycan binding domain
METFAYLLVSQDYEARNDFGDELGQILPSLVLSNLSIANLLSLSCAIWLLGLSSGAIAQTYDSDGLYPSSIYAFTADRAYSNYYKGSSTAYLLPEDSIYASDVYAYVRPSGSARQASIPCNGNAYSIADPTAGYLPIAPASSLQVGDSGDQVRSLQDLLRNAGYFSRASTGYFGSTTESAVIAFQQDYGLMVDGVAGSQTIAALQGRS